MNREERKTKIGSALALLLFGIFAVCVLAVLLGGANVYRNLTERGTSGHDDRTAVQYLTTRVRQADAADSLRVESFDGLDALVASEEIDGEWYETRIYCHNGYIRELFAAAQSDLVPEDGNPVIPAAELSVEKSGAQLQMEILSTDGSVQRLVLFLRSGKEVCP